MVDGSTLSEIIVSLRVFISLRVVTKLTKKGTIKQNVINVVRKKEAVLKNQLVNTYHICHKICSLSIIMYYMNNLYRKMNCFTMNTYRHFEGFIDMKYSSSYRRVIRVHIQNNRHSFNQLKRYCSINIVKIFI